MLNAADVLKFWFEEIETSYWFKKDTDFDAQIVSRFAQTHQQAAAGELWQWRDTAEGRLAEVIVLDQFSRNMFRDTPQAFAFDTLALVLAQEAVSLGMDAQLADNQVPFLYMPYMHSESAKVQAQSVELFSRPAAKNSLAWAISHKDIIDRFGRYPHRNSILGRESSAEEIAFLQQPGSSF